MANKNDQKELEPQSLKPIEITETETEKVVLPTRDSVVEKDDLVNAIVDGSGTFELLDMVIKELAEDCAQLKYERIKKVHDEKDIERIVLRHANILKMVSESLIQKRNLVLNDIINLKSPQWQMVHGEFLKRIKQTLIDLRYSSEQIELFFDKLTKNLEGFEEQTEIKLKESLNTMG